MSSTHASPEADSRSENYLAAFSHRESDIIRSVVASVLAGEVPRDAIAEVRSFTVLRGESAADALQTG